MKKINLIILLILLPFVLSSNYPGGASHSTLYAYTITDRSAGAGPNLVTVADNLYVTGNLGVGAPISTHELHVVGDINSTGLIYSNGDQVCTPENGLCAGGGGLWTLTGSDIYYDAGNVGIGTNSPATDLQIGTSGVGDSNYISIGKGEPDSSGIFWLRGGGAEAAILSDANENLVFLTDLTNSFANTNFHFVSGGVNLVTILDTGNLGIGTATPSQRLHVDGNVNISGINRTVYFNDIDGCIYMGGTKAFCGNSTCRTIHSPDGNSVVEVCN